VSQPDYSPMSFRLGAGSCGAIVPTGPHGQPTSCPAPVTRCGLLLHRPKNLPAEAWLAFACETHAVRLVAARELLDRDRAVLDRRRAEEQRWRPGTPPRGRPGLWRRPEPLARGGEAVQLVERARRWAEQQAATGAS
jgi:hypothetical protein